MKTALRLLKYSLKNVTLVILAFLFALISNGLAIAAPFIIGKATVLMLPKNVDFAALLEFCVILAIMYILAALFNFLGQIVSHQISARAVENIRRDVFIRMSKMRLDFYDTAEHGMIMQRLTSDMDYVSEGLFQLIIQLFGGMVAIVGSILFMVFLNWQMALIIIALTPLCFLLTRIISKTASKYFKEQTKITGQMNAFLEEIVTGQKVIQTFNYEKESYEKYSKQNAELYKCGYKSQFFSSLTNPGARLLNNIIYIITGVFGAFLAINKGFGLDIISSFLIYSIQFAQPINNITAVTTQLQSAFASAQRIFNILDNEIEPPDDKNAVIVLPKKKNIKFKDISFSYNEQTKLIQNFSLDVKPGMKVAIVGRTGSGKTTLVNLLMRFYEVQKGTIEISGINTKTIARPALRKSFAMVLQETWLKSGSVLDNIIYGNKSASEEEIQNVLKLSGCDSFINKLPDGLNTYISENATLISQGQKQLLTIARAMLNLPDMLILDEATSSVDILTEQKIAAAFDKIMVGRTSFIIAHRLSTIKHCDIILVLEKGNIVEQGTHCELIEKDGLYAKLFKSQFEAIS